jgi:hypothetical protein
MRLACLDCARKHLAQAEVLLDEAAMGYPVHFWLAMGHMAEASSELIEKYPELAEQIRTVRLKMQEDNKFKPNLCELISIITMVADKDGT